MGTPLGLLGLDRYKAQAKLDPWKNSVGQNMGQAKAAQNKHISPFITLNTLGNYLWNQHGTNGKTTAVEVEFK